MDRETGRIWNEEQLKIMTGEITFEGAIKKLNGMGKRVVALDDISESNLKAAMEREPPRVGRNDQCPCGSGKKFKKCCLIKKWKERYGKL